MVIIVINVTFLAPNAKHQLIIVPFVKIPFTSIIQEHVFVNQGMSMIQLIIV